MGHDGVHRGVHAGERAARHFFIEHGLVAKVATGTTPLFRHIGAQQAGLAGFAPELVAHMAALARGFVGGLHLFLDEAHHGVAVLFEVGVAPGTVELQGHVSPVR